MRVTNSGRAATRLNALIRLLLLLLLVPTGSPVFAAPPTEAFARLPTFTDLEISPGGRYLAARVNLNNRYIVNVYGFSGSGIKNVYAFKEDNTLSVDWFRWVSSDRLLVSIAFVGTRQGRRFVQRQERRLVSLDTVTGTLTGMFPNRRRETPVQVQDNIVSFLPKDPEHILVQYPTSDPSAPSVYEVDVAGKSRHKRVLRGKRGIQRWMADGAARFAWGQA